MKLVYIIGLGHSGSTLLDLMLSGNSKVCGMGEIAMMTDPNQRQSRFDRAETSRCGCGSTVSECAIWGEYLRRHEEQKCQSMQESYQQYFNVCSDVLGDDVWISDSSKSMRAFKELSRIAKKSTIEIRLLFLTRDIRSFIASELARSNKSGIIAALRSARFWKKSSEEFLAFTNQVEFPAMRVGYEELCLYPDYMMQTISDFLSISFTEKMLSPATESSHVATGNPMRVDPQRNRKTIYDNRWYFRKDVGLASLLLPGAFKLNRELVYHNSASDSLSSFRPPSREQNSKK